MSFKKQAKQFEREIGKAIGEKVAAKVKNPYNPRDVEKAINAELSQWSFEDLVDFGSDTAALILETIASDRDSVEGQAVSMFDTLDLPVPDEDTPEYEEWLEWGIEEAEDAFDDVADQINKKTKLPGTIGFGWEEGGFHMFYYFEKEDHPELD